ncbi:MAG: helix-turn-helix domain-containing protein [Chitinophagaceae bacterium]
MPKPKKLYNKKEIAEKLCISQQVLNNLINERMGVSTSILHNIFIVYDISADYFL